MIRNGVICARAEFEERRMAAVAQRAHNERMALLDEKFDALKQEVFRQRGLDIEIARETFKHWNGLIYAVIDDVLINNFTDPVEIADWQGAKARA